MELQHLIEVVLSNANRPLVHIVNSDPLVSVQLLEVLLRAGLRVDVSETGEDFIMKASGTQPDALVIDFKLSDDDGAVLLEWLGSAEIAPTTPVIMVGEAVEMAQLLNARNTGAIGARSTQRTENLRRPPRDVVRPFARHPKTAAVVPSPEQFPALRNLTPRQFEVLKIIAAGGTNKDAGEKLGVSPRTIETHRRALMQKLRARNTADLMRILATRKLPD